MQLPWPREQHFLGNYAVVAVPVLFAPQGWLQRPISEATKVASANATFGVSIRAIPGRISVLNSGIWRLPSAQFEASKVASADATFGVVFFAKSVAGLRVPQVGELRLLALRKCCKRRWGSSTGSSKAPKEEKSCSTSW